MRHPDGQDQPGQPGRSWSSADLVAGAVFVVAGAAFAIGSLPYARGTLLQMGPGYVPFAVGLMLAALGVAVGVKAFVAPDHAVPAPPADQDSAQVARAAEELTDDAEGPGSAPARATTTGASDRPAPLDFGRVKWRPVLLVLAAVLFFAYTLEGLGLLVTVFVTVVLASYARAGTTVREALITSVSLALARWLIFVVALQQRIPLVGEWLGG